MRTVAQELDESIASDFPHQQFHAEGTHCMDDSVKLHKVAPSEGLVIPTLNEEALCGSDTALPHCAQLAAQPFSAWQFSTVRNAESATLVSPSIVWVGTCQQSAYCFVCTNISEPIESRR